jgi:hypothetical protein
MRSEGIVVKKIWSTTPRKFVPSHYGRDNIVRKNILAYSRQYQWRSRVQNRHRSAVIEGNIIYWAKPGQALGTPRYRGTEKARAEWRAMCGGARTGPSISNGKTLEQWQARPRHGRAGG